MHSLIDGLAPLAKPPLGFLAAQSRLTVEFVRQGGKGHFARIEATAYPARAFTFEASPGAWTSAAEQSEYEPHLLHGLLEELMSVAGARVLGIRIVIEAAVCDEMRSSPMAFFNVGRLFVLRLLAPESPDGERKWLEGF